MTDINPCPPTVCLHVQLDHCQILNCYKYLKNPRPLNTEYREVLVQVLVISLNFFLNKVLSTQFERAVRSFCFSKSTLTLLAATLLTRPRAFRECSDVRGCSVFDVLIVRPGFAPLPLMRPVVRIRRLFLGVVTC